MLAIANCNNEVQGESICGIRAVGVAHAALEELPALKQRPSPPGGIPIASNFLRLSDEQTIVGLAATLRAVHDFQLRDLSDWGILGAPQFMGRLSLASSLYKFQREGAWSTSPLIIPHHCLHSLSGTISLALGIHGPNLGIGGGSGAVEQAFLTGLAWLQDQRLPGVLVVLTGWHPEPIPDEQGRSLVPATCYGAALALVPAVTKWSGARLTLSSAGSSATNSLNMHELIDMLRSGTCQKQWPIAGLSGFLELEWRTPLDRRQPAAA
jgi:hypothetical protein